MSRDREALLEKAIGAKQAISSAERDLELALKEIVAAPRAEKVAISGPLERAFGKLREARASLTELHTALAASHTDPPHEE